MTLKDKANCNPLPFTIIMVVFYGFRQGVASKLMLHGITNVGIIIPITYNFLYRVKEIASTNLITISVLDIQEHEIV